MTCEHCGASVYRCLSESFGSTGWLIVKTQYRHEATGRIACAGRPVAP